MSTSYTTTLLGYQPKGYPSLGNDKQYLVAELNKISNAINAIVTALQLLEKRMNTDGLA